MSNSPILPEDEWFIGADRTFEFFLFTGAPVVATVKANAGATALTVMPLEDALAASQVLVFRIQRPAGYPDYLASATVVGGGAAQGASVVNFAAGLNFDVHPQMAGRLPLNATGFVLEWVVREEPGASAELFAAQVPAIANGFDTNDKATVTITDALTGSLDPGRYYHTLRRTDDGFEHIYAYGAAHLLEPATR